MRTLQASTSYGVGIPSFVAPSRLRLRHRHVILAKAEHSEKSVEIMRKFSEQYAHKSGTYFCVDKGVTSVVIKVITRINYGQSISISGLAGAVSLAGSRGGLWAIERGNWQMAARLINSSDIALHLHEEIESISYLGDYYELNSTKGNSYM